MNQNDLTICIPSYNRPDDVQNTLLRLFTIECNLNFRVVIFDNCSDEDYFFSLSQVESLKEKIENQQLLIRRNHSNIGMSANIMRCFEEEIEGWLWILADDDHVCSDAFLKIKQALVDEDLDKLSCVYFGSYDGVPQHHAVDSLSSFIDLNLISINNFNQSIFLSNTIYHMKKMKNHISVGYMNSGTYIPHFMMVVDALNEGRALKYVNTTIVEFVKPEVGYSYSMVAGLGVGLPKHSILRLSDREYKKFTKLFYPHNDFKVIVDLFYEARRHSASFRYLSGYYLSYVRRVRSVPHFAFLLCVIVLAQYAFLFETLLNLLCKFNKRVAADVAEIRIRNS